MPKIIQPGRQIASPNVAAPVRVTAAQTGGLQARATQQLGQGLSSVGQMLQKRQEQQEVSDLSARMSAAHAGLANELQEYIKTADPGDTTIVEKFGERVETVMGEIEENVSTRAGGNYYAQNAARLKGHFLNASFQGQAELSGVKAQQDYTATINSLSSGLIADPSSYELSSGMHTDAVNQLVSSGQLSSAVGAKLKTQGQAVLAKSSARGWIKINPEFAKEKLESGVFDKTISGDLKIQLISEADQKIRSKDIEAERQKREAKRLKVEKDNLTQNEMLKQMSKGELTTEDVLDSNLESFGSGSKQQFLNMIKTSNKANGKITTNPDVMLGLFNRVHLPDGDPDKIVDENQLNQFFGQLSMDDLNSLRAEVQQKRTQAGAVEADLKKGVMTIARNQLTKSDPMMGIKDPEGDTQLQRYMVFFLQEYKEQRAKGKSASELLNPDSKEYLGRYINNYTKTPQQIMESTVNRMRGRATPPMPLNIDAPKRKEGESAANYLKRTKEGK